MFEFDVEGMLNDVMPQIMAMPVNDIITQEVKDSWVEFAVSQRSNKLCDAIENFDED